MDRTATHEGRPAAASQRELMRNDSPPLAASQDGMSAAKSVRERARHGAGCVSLRSTAPDPGGGMGVGPGANNPGDRENVVAYQDTGDFKHALLRCASYKAPGQPGPVTRVPTPGTRISAPAATSSYPDRYPFCGGQRVCHRIPLSVTSRVQSVCQGSGSATGQRPMTLDAECSLTDTNMRMILIL